MQLFALSLQPPVPMRRAALLRCGYPREVTREEHDDALWAAVFETDFTFPVAIIWAHGVPDDEEVVTAHLAVHPHWRHDLSWWRSVAPHVRLLLRGFGACWLRIDEPRLYNFACRRLGFAMREGRPHLET